MSYFDSAFTEDEPLLTPLPDDFVDAMSQEQFKGFSYTDPNYALPALWKAKKSQKSQKEDISFFAKQASIRH